MTIDPFRTRDHVADFEGHVCDYAERSARTRTSLRMIGDVAYGDGPMETLDLFFPAEGGIDRPVHMFVHGGYWRMFSKRDFSFVADTVTRAGAIAAIVDYALMPAVRMREIVEQVRKAKRWLLMNARANGGDPARLTVSGHSAGAHLASLLLTRDQAPSGVGGAMLLGGVYDLRPLQSSFLEPLIGITDEEVARFTPIDHAFATGIDVAIAYGDGETAPFHEQAAALGRRLERQRLRVGVTALKDADHMSSVRDLGLPDSEAGRILTDLILRN